MAHALRCTERMIDGPPAAHLQPRGLVCRDEHRATCLRMLRSLLRQRAYTFTDLTPRAAVVV